MVSCLGSLVQSCCREGGALQTNVTGLCGEHSQCSGHTGFAPLMGVCSPRLYCSGSRLLSRERALRGVDFPGLSRSDSGFRVFHKGAGSVGPAFCAFQGGVAQAARSLRSTLSPGAACIVPSTAQPQFWARRSGTPCVCSELDSSCDPSSGCRPSSISGSL